MFGARTEKYMMRRLQRFTQKFVNVLLVLTGLVVVSSILIYSGCGMTNSRPNTPAGPTPTPTPTPTPDTLAPTSAITAPAAGATVKTATTVNISGTASDAGGGSVARVEVSVDGGATYSAATGTTAWSFNWTPSAPGPATIKSRAIDNSGNVQDPPAQVDVTVQDATRPTSTITSPTDGATVLIGTPVAITGTASDAGGGSVDRVEVSVDGGATFSAATGTNSWSFNWTPSFPGPATIKSRAVDNAGNVQDPPAEITVLVADNTPPTVTSFSPLDGAINVSLFVNVNVTFNEQIDSSTVNNSTVKLQDPSGALTPAEISYNSASRAVTLDPTAPLAEETRYTAVVKGGDTGVKDLAGNPLAADLTWSFTTTPPPQVLSVTPERDATNISPDVTPAATFSQALDPTTVNSSTVELTDATTMPVNSKILYVRSVGRIMVVPDEPLQVGQTYTITLKGGPGSPRITNLGGAPLASDYTWSFTTVFSDTTGCPSVSFNVTPRIDLPFDDYGERLLVKDFNQDSIPDLVIVMASPFAPKRVSFFPGASDGGFGSPVNTLTLSGNRALINDVTAGDFNGDGALDIVAISEDDLNAWSVWVILNNGVGGFASPARFVSSEVLRRASAGDFNNDGKTDLVVGIIDDERTADGLLFLNDGAGNFGQPQRILRADSISPHNPQSVTPTDLDGDGNLDLVFLYNAEAPAIYKGNGAGGFTPQPEIGDGFFWNSSAIGDFNGDGRPDLLAVEPEGSQDNLRVYLNDGTGRFGEPVITPSGEAVFNVQGAIADDFDGDGKTDVVIRAIDRSSNRDTGIRLFIATTDGRFIEPVGYHPSVMAPAIATSDFNHDGLPDILSINNRGSLTIVMNRGGGFNAPRGIAYSGPGLQYNVGDLKSADLNGDGALDLAVSSTGLSDVAIMLGAGHNKFSDPILISSGIIDGLPLTIEIQDFNNDGNLDLAALYAITRKVVVLLGNGQGGFTPSATINIGVNVNTIISADFNNDGKLDLVVRGASGGLALCIGNGQGGFTQIDTGIGGNTPDFVFTAGDFDGDGNRDLAIFDLLQNGVGGFNIVILPGDGQGGFGQPSNVSVPERLLFLSAKDLNLDGQDDLIYTPSNIGHAIYVALSNPGGGFGAPVAYEVGSAGPVVTTDINGDGNLDLISANFDAGTVSLLLGDGDGSFNQQTPLPVFVAPFGIATGDFDRDGRIDLAIPRSGAPIIAIINNRTMCILQSGASPASSASGK
jgi:hypothetical protein